MTRKHFYAGVAAASVLCAGAMAASFDKAAAPVGNAVFQLVQDEVVKGQMVYKTRFQDGAYIIDEATAMQPDIKETGTFVLDGETFRPQRIIVDADFSGNILDADLRVEAGAITGDYRTKAPGAIDKKITPVTIELPDGVVTRASMFALAAALPLKDGETYPITWFSSLSGQLQEITVVVEGAETVSVPAGEFDAIVVRFKGATPENVLYIAKASRDVVRIDVPTMNMRFERLAPPEAAPE